MESTRYISPPCDSEGAALASVETLMTEAGRGKKGKFKVTHKNAYEADGVWIAECTVEFEEEPEQEEEADLQQPAPANDTGGDGIELYVAMRPITTTPSIEIDAPLPLEPTAQINMQHTGPEPDIVLAQDFKTAETENGLVPILVEGLDLAAQERLAHDARMTQEYAALRRKIQMEELATLTPKAENDDLKPEPGIAA